MVSAPLDSCTQCIVSFVSNKKEANTNLFLFLYSASARLATKQEKLLTISFTCDKISVNEKPNEQDYIVRRNKLDFMSINLVQPITVDTSISIMPSTTCSTGEFSLRLQFYIRKKYHVQKKFNTTLPVREKTFYSY